MARGIKPKPAAIKVYEGNPGKRDIQREPEPPKGLPQPPDYLDDVGRRAWHEVLSTMGCTGAITLAEGHLLELFADTFSKYHQAREAVNRLGIALVERDSDGTAKAKANPFATQLHKYRDASHKLLMELGMTPVSRARIGLSQQDDDSLAKEFLA